MTIDQTEVANEEARNLRYLALLREWVERPVTYGIARNRMWVDPSPHAGGKSYDLLHPLVGRVGLVSETEFLNRDFYVGSTHREEGDLRVFSWAAPVAELFFRSDRRAQATYDEVAVRRTFSHRLDSITDLDDEWVVPLEFSPFTLSELVVPAPTRPRSRRPIRETPDSTEQAGEAPVAASSSTASGIPSPHTQGMRAVGAVLKRLAQPRTNQLSSVLSTLQPDQYDLVSAAADSSLIVQGHPGSGKTIVAAYRASFLTSDLEDGAPRVSKLLLVGPTAEYVQHVRGLIRPLDPNGRGRVTSLAELLDKTVGLGKEWSGGIGGEHDDVDAHTRGLAEAAARILTARRGFRVGAGAAHENLKSVYELVASNGTSACPLSRDPARVAWMKKLPPFEQATKLRRFLPLMAQLVLAYKPVPSTDRYAHIVVDEAQDVSPIEWNVLDQFLNTSGSWTLVGDLNQRRSDTSYASWQDIADHLGVGDGDASVEVVAMRRGYRSTRPILQFADKLLPVEQRGNDSIQGNGPPVRVERASSASTLITRALCVAAEMAEAHHEGTVAVITVDPGSVISEMGRSGWRRSGDFHTWSLDDTTLEVFAPEHARGLEFDAVVVVEPIDFPKNLGRDGQLYTSLTRANRELAVVWSSVLPDPLRKAARS